MVDIINYIRNLIFAQPDTRKRRATLEEYEIPISPKIRRISTSQMSNTLEDDWHSTSSSNSIKRRSGLRNTSPTGTKLKPSWSKENNLTVTIDDDDDILEISKIKSKSWMDPLKTSGRSHYTSTPNDNQRMVSHRNSDDDVIFLKSTQTANEKKVNAKKQGYEYIKPSYSYLSDNQNKRRIIQNGNSHTRDFTSPILSSVREIKTKLGLHKRPTIRSTMLEQSFRLEEKAKYKRLLSQGTAASALRDSFSKYNVPTGKLFPTTTQSRGKKMVNMVCGKDKPAAVIDLTSNGNDKEKPRLSTRDTIKKVLNDFDNEPVTVKDSDSDVEILPTPPSPKPDIQVERVNSLKKVIDTKEHTSVDWLKKMVQKHQEDIARYEHEIRAQTEQKKKLNAVTSEVYAQRLENQMVKCLSIKDAVLPVQISEEAVFPELTEEDEEQINAALNRRGDPSEVLIKKFNLNITRRDIQTLAGLNWLNDEVINFYMNLLIERGKDPKWPKVYAMNTFFYPKLLKDGPSSLRRWTRRVDIFAHDIMVVPVHLGVHWCMSVIDFQGNTIRYYDSMGSANRQCLEALLHYLQAEHLDKKQTEFDISGWSLENMRDIPQQMNGSDCGMFACTFAEFLCRNAKITFSQEDMPYLRQKMVLEILNGELLIK